MVDPIVSISIFSLVFSILSFAVNYKIGNRKKVKQLQKEVNEFQKKFEKATREKDEKELQHLKNLEQETMAKMQEMLLLPLKSMVVILPLFFIFISGIESFHRGFYIVLPLALHPSELLSLNVLHASTYGPRGFFILSSIVFNLIFETILSKFIVNDKAKEK